MIFRYCPDCGFECTQINFKMFKCNECKLEYFDQPAAGVAGLIKNPEGKYLFIVRKNEPGKGSLAIPGGFVDNDETLEQGFSRESKEETGVEISNIRYFGSYHSMNHYNGKPLTIIASFFTAETNGHGVITDEISDLLWLYPKEIDIDKIKLTDIKQFVRDFLKSL